jgi:hypothetical protein
MLSGAEEEVTNTMIDEVQELELLAVTVMLPVYAPTCLPIGTENERATADEPPAEIEDGRVPFDTMSETPETSEANAEMP